MPNFVYVTKWRFSDKGGYETGKCTVSSKKDFYDVHFCDMDGDAAECYVYSSDGTLMRTIHYSHKTRDYEKDCMKEAVEYAKTLLQMSIKDTW